MMSKDERLESFIEIIEKEKGKKKIIVNKFLLFFGKYSILSRIFLKEFMTSKKETDNLAQIYC
jgi:hypothetical protein